MSLQTDSTTVDTLNPSWPKIEPPNLNSVLYISTLFTQGKCIKSLACVEFIRCMLYLKRPAAATAGGKCNVLCEMNGTYISSQYADTVDLVERLPWDCSNKYGMRISRDMELLEIAAWLMGGGSLTWILTQPCRTLCGLIESRREVSWCRATYWNALCVSQHCSHCCQSLISVINYICKTKKSYKKTHDAQTSLRPFPKKKCVRTLEQKKSTAQHTEKSNLQTTTVGNLGHSLKIFQYKWMLLCKY